MAANKYKKEEELDVLDQTKKELSEKISKLGKTSGVLFKTINGYGIVLVPPKILYRNVSGYGRTNLRYIESENSIFEEEQRVVDPKLEHIVIDKSILVADPNLVSYLLMSNLYGSRFEIDDPQAQAKAAMEKVELFDNVWSKINKKSESEIHALHMLVFNSTYSFVVSSGLPLCKMALREETKKNPEKMDEFLSDPLQKGVYLYGAGVALGEIIYDRRNNIVKWAGSKEEICTIPVGDMPSIHFAKEMVNPDNADVKASLETKILGK